VADFQWAGINHRGGIKQVRFIIEFAVSRDYGFGARTLGTII
jgi:hypothetical protein